MFSSFFMLQMTIRNFPVAQALYIKYCKEHNPQALNEIYIQEDDFNSQAQLFIMESLDPEVGFYNDIKIQVILNWEVLLVT